METRIREEKFINKTVYYPEWFCSNTKASNYGWNMVHDKNLMSLPLSTVEEAQKNIEWFLKCFEKPKEIIIHINDKNMKNDKNGYGFTL